MKSEIGKRVINSKKKGEAHKNLGPKANKEKPYRGQGR